MSLRVEAQGGRLSRYLQSVMQVAMGKRPAGRELTVLPKDLYLVSYYRSGNTWIRFLVSNLLSPNEPVTFANIETRVPPIYLYSDRVLRSLPRILKSHESFDPRYPKMIYILRDPRDVAVSFYYYLLKMRVLPEGYAMDDFIPRFLTANIVPYADRVGSWEDHVQSWLRLRQGKPNFHVIRYEDLQADAGRELAKVAPMLGVDPTPENIDRAVRLSSASNMRAMEEKQSKDWVTIKGSRQDIRFVRDAKSGGWRDKLSPKSVRALEQAWGATMRQLGYELSSVAEPEAQPVR